MFERPFSHTQAKTGTARVIRPDAYSIFELEYIVFFEKPHLYGGIHLRECEGGRRLCFSCGYFESTAIVSATKHDAARRPWTYPGVAMIIAALGGHLEDIYISEFDEARNYHANLRIRQGHNLINVDLRPSDALALAVVCKVPIIVTEAAWEEGVKGQTEPQ